MVEHLIAFATSHYLLVGAFVILLALLIAHEMSRGGRSISTGELTGLVNRDEGVVIDIRPVKDFAAGHIVGSLNIPQDKLMARIAELDKHKGKTIILVDAAGQHSGAMPVSCSRLVTMLPSCLAAFPAGALTTCQW